MSYEVDANTLRKLMKEAVDVARRLSVNESIVGYVARIKPVSIERGGSEVSISIEFHDYLRLSSDDMYPVGIGSMLCIVNPIAKTVTLGVIKKLMREDLASLMNIPVPTPPTDPSTLQTPLILNIELIAEASITGEELSNLRPPVTAIEPGSPVIIPKPDVVKEMLRIPKEGVIIGHLISGSQVRYDIDVRLPLDTLYHHVLVIGTTGSGKTALLKNIAVAIAHEYRKENPLVIAFDLQGDYLTLTLPRKDLEDRLRVYKQLNELSIIIPMTRSIVKSLGSVGSVDELVKKLVDLYVRLSYRGLNAEVVNVDLSSEGMVGSIDVMLEDAEGNMFKLTLIPWALVYSRVRSEVQDLIPIFTEQAKLFLPRLLSEVHEGLGVEEYLDTVLESSSYVQSEGERLRIHRSTIDNIIRGLVLLRDTELFDVGIEVGDRTIMFSEPDYSNLFTKSSNVIVVDLRWVRLYSPSPYAETLVTYRILEKVFRWKDEALRRGVRSRPTVLLIDEAHNYFPQTSREVLRKDLVEYMISRITRLGRVRGIGVVFATHQPSDLNNLIVQLTNTKIALRSDRASLEAIGLTEFHNELRNAESGYAVMTTYAIGVQSLTIKTLPPQTLHEQ